MFEHEKIVSLTPTKNMKVKLKLKNYYNEDGKLTPFEEIKDVICLALTEDTRYDNRTSVHPMIFNEYIDFAESENTDIIDLYYTAEGE